MGNQTLMRYPKVSVSWAPVLPRSRLFNPGLFSTIESGDPAVDHTSEPLWHRAGLH